jgi:hypothetical protein
MLKFLKLLKSSQKEHRSEEANSKSKIIAKKVSCKINVFSG